MKLKQVTISVLILLSLIPVYALIKYLQKIIRPRENMVRLFFYILSVLSFIFIYTFLLTLGIRLAFKVS
jgi:hypothetical protein